MPGARVWLFAAPPGVRRTLWSLLIAEDPLARVLTVIDPAGANARVRGLLDRGLVPGVSPDWAVKPEVSLGDSRIDFLLSRGKDRLALEVKSVGVVRNGVALFPDAPTVRGARHLRSLEDFVRTKQGKAMVLFVAQREDATSVSPDEEIRSGLCCGVAPRRTCRRASRRALCGADGWMCFHWRDPGPPSVSGEAGWVGAPLSVFVSNR